MDSETRAGRQHRVDEGLEEGRKLTTQKRVREHAEIKPITPAGDQRTDPDRGTGEAGLEALDPSAPLDEDSDDDVGVGQSNR